MSAKAFSSMQAFSYGFDTVFANLRFFIPVMITFATVVAVISLMASAFTGWIISSMPNGTFALAALIPQILAFIAFLAITFGLIKISLGFCGGERPNISNIFEPYQLFLYFLAASVIYLLMTYVGFILLFVPGVYVLLKYGFYGYSIINRGFSPIDALKRSGEITKGAKWSLFVFLIELYFGVVVIDIFAAILTLIPSGILTFLANIVYPSLQPIELLSIMITLMVSLINLVIVSPSYMLALAFIYKDLERKKTIDPQNSAIVRDQTKAIND